MSQNADFPRNNSRAPGEPKHFVYSGNDSFYQCFFRQSGLLNMLCFLHNTEGGSKKNFRTSFCNSEAQSIHLKEQFKVVSILDKKYSPLTNRGLFIFTLEWSDMKAFVNNPDI